MIRVLSVLVLLAVLGAGCRAAPAPGSTVIRPNGPERQAQLEAGAQREARVIWYSALGGDTSASLAAAFEARYPGLSVDLVRTGNAELLARVSEERLAGRAGFDLITASQSTLAALRDLGALQPFRSPVADSYPDSAREPAADGGTNWIINVESYLGFAYNTRLLRDDEIAHTYQELLKPSLKGKMAILGSDAGLRLIGNLAQYQGDDFLRRFAEQEVAVQMVGSQALVDLIASGEVPASPSIYRSLAQTSVAKGAPIRWLPLEPVTVSALGVALAAGAPHPHAAQLAGDFLLDADAQQILVSLDYGSPAMPLGYQRWDPEKVRTLGEYAALHQRWEALFKDTLTRR